MYVKINVRSQKDNVGFSNLGQDYEYGIEFISDNTNRDCNIIYRKGESSGTVDEFVPIQIPILQGEKKII